jgi:hypothetical protein
MKSDCESCEKRVECLTQAWSFCPKLDKKVRDAKCGVRSVAATGSIHTLP